jgi:hypothetical protein
VKYIPYSCQSITPEDVDAVTTVLRSQYLTQGPVIPAFEQAFSALQQIPHIELMTMQRDAFLSSEGDAWFYRNKATLESRDSSQHPVRAKVGKE